MGIEFGTYLINCVRGEFCGWEFTICTTFDFNGLRVIVSISN